MFPDTELSEDPQEAGVVRCPLPTPTPTQHCSSDLGRICITVAPFTGGPFEVKVSRGDTIEELKKLIARRLKVAKERIYLLYRESELIDGSVGQNLLVDGSTVTLLPRAETGLISPKPEQSVMQALESLNEQQVNDFLSGAAPLNLTMRLGDHMMLIQLQLSTVNQLSSSRRKSSIQISSSSSASPPFPASISSRTKSSSSIHTPSSSSSSSSLRPTSSFSSSSSSLTSIPTSSSSTSSSSSSSKSGSASSPTSTSSQKVRLPLLSPGGLYYTSGGLPTVPSTDSSFNRSLGSVPPPPSSSSTSATSHSEGLEGCEPPSKKPKLDTKALAEASKNLTQTLKQLSSEVLTTKPQPRQSTSTPKPKKEEKSRKRRATDNRGAIIESMHHHGKGVYSGTFSGTLNPALQDANGQPKRDITTIVHILNDLLCAQYKAYNSSSRSSKHREKSAQSADQKQNFGREPDQTERELSEQQLNITRSKMEALKRIMEERRAKREARRQAQSRPYSTAWSVKSESKHVEGSDEAGDAFLKVEPEPVTA